MRKGRRILIVEDEGLMALHLKMVVMDSGYQVVGVASSMQEACSMTDQAMPELLLMDIILRGTGDGIEAVRRIRQKHDIPVIYITGNADDNTIARALVSKPEGLLIKPVEDAELIRRIDEIFEDLGPASKMVH